MGKNNNPLVSIIVPVHNAGTHFGACMDSLVNQTLREIEIIIVLDCPTDGSDLVAKQYALVDDRIKIIENAENIHIGMSRNRGLDAARGEFVGFSDHDDFRELRMYEKLVQRAREDSCDIVVSAYGAKFPNRVIQTFYPPEMCANLSHFNLKVLIGGYRVPKDWDFFIQNGGMWNKLYRRELLEDNDIRFVDNRKCTYEDLLFLIQCNLAAKKISLVNEVFYYHLEDVGNASTLHFYNKKELVKNYLKTLYHILQNSGSWEAYSMDFYKAVVNAVIVSLANEQRASRTAGMKSLSYFRDLRFVRDAFKLMTEGDVIYPPRNFQSHAFRKVIFSLYRA